MADIWLATKNAKKAAELVRLVPPAVKVRTLAELPEAAGFDVIEDGATFRANAMKKARETAAFLRRHGVRGDALVLADDSGLCVDALGGAPGIASARWAGPDKSDADRVAKLLGTMAGVPAERRTARFVCSLAAVRIDGLPWFDCEATCEGRILGAPSGSGGFGYDPIFAPAEAPAGLAGRSFADLEPSEKDAISHRGQALRAFAARLAEPASADEP